MTQWHFHLPTLEKAGEGLWWSGHGARAKGNEEHVHHMFVSAVVLLKRKLWSVVMENWHLKPQDLGNGSNLRGATQKPLCIVVGLGVTIVQTTVLDSPAGRSATFHLQHVFQAFHYLHQDCADVGLFEEHCPWYGCWTFKHCSWLFWALGPLVFYCFGKSCFCILVKVLGTEIGRSLKTRQQRWAVPWPVAWLLQQPNFTFSCSLSEGQNI